MTNQATLNTLTQSVRRRLNLTNMNTISDAEIKEFLKDSLGALHEILVSRWRDYYVRKATISFAMNQEEYLLPDNFRAMTAVYLTYGQSQAIGQQQRLQMSQFNMNQFASWGPDFFVSNPWPVMYRVMGSTTGQGTSIFFTPVPRNAAPGACEIWYVPAFSAPVTDDTTISNFLPNGWELWVIFDTCVYVSARLRLTDFYALMDKERGRAEARLIAGAAIRDETAPTMVDVYATPSTSFFRTPGT